LQKHLRQRPRAKTARVLIKSEQVGGSGAREIAKSAQIRLSYLNIFEGHRPWRQRQGRFVENFRPKRGVWGGAKIVSRVFGRTLTCNQEEKNGGSRKDAKKGKDPFFQEKVVLGVFA
jgi:hypothetical protein